jgi:uncharacterized protein YhbP (UPF0306 family)
MNDIDKAKKIISENIYATVATSDKDNNPWISPVFFAFDSRHNLYWVSNKEARHSQNIRENLKVAIVVFNSQAKEGDGDAVYFECEASELTDESELASAIEIYNERATQKDFRVKNVASVSGDNLWRVYKAVPISISKLSDGEVVNGQYVDKRFEISLNA